MKRIDIPVLFLFCILLIFISCSEKKEQPELQANNKKDRNMFGYGIPRGLTKTSDGLADGYILFAVPNSPYTYLINRKGEVVHEWKGNYGVTHAYLMEDGSLVQGASDPDFPEFGCCGPFGRVQKITWDNKMLWDFEYATEEHIIHHDFTILPNGNILAIANDAMSYNDAIARGRKPELTPPGGPWLEKIVEIEPQGRRGGKVVWEWHVSDHLIQDFDPSKENYGKPADHPELLDINLGHHIPPAISQDSIEVLISKGMAHRNTNTENRGADAFHFNAIKYNHDLDQIVFSAQSINEIYVIDHSTTTKEAASHKGGRSGKGGDFLFRWGNPKNYQRGDSTNRQLFGQHDVRWIEKGLPGEGHITLFNNYPPNEIDWSNMGNMGKNYSMIFELEIKPDQSGNYPIDIDKPYGPEKPVWTYMAPDTLSFYSSFISGAHRMANGNTFINEGAKGRFFEVTPEGEIVWEYLNPYRGEIREPNGDPINPMFMPFSMFRVTFIPANHPAFAGKELKPLDPQPKPFVLPPPPKEEMKK